MSTCGQWHLFTNSLENQPQPFRRFMRCTSGEFYFVSLLPGTLPRWMRAASQSRSITSREEGQTAALGQAPRGLSAGLCPLPTRPRGCRAEKEKLTINKTTKHYTLYFSREALFTYF